MIDEELIDAIRRELEAGVEGANERIGKLGGRAGPPILISVTMLDGREVLLVPEYPKSKFRGRKP